MNTAKFTVEGFFMKMYGSGLCAGFSIVVVDVVCQFRNIYPQKADCQNGSDKYTQKISAVWNHQVC